MMAMDLQINMQSTVSTRHSTEHGENEIYILWFLTVCYLAEGTEEMKMSVSNNPTSITHGLYNLYKRQILH